MDNKVQQNDDGTISDSVTTENQRGYANYEADLKQRQEEMTSKDAKRQRQLEALMQAGMGLLSRPAKAKEGKAKGGMVKSSASKRADGCAIKGKTRGRMV
jgi:hypothetical protein